MNGKIHTEQDWGLAYNFMLDYIDLLEQRYGKDDYLTTALKEDLGEPEDFRKRWEGLGEEQKDNLLEKAKLGAKAFLEQYDKSSEAQAIREAVEEAANMEPFDEETITRTKQLMSKAGKY